MRTRVLSAIPLLLVLGACGGDGGRDAASVATTSTTAAFTSTTSTSTTASTVPSTSTTPSTTSTTVAPLSPASRLRIDGLGPVNVGMTLDQAQAAAAIPLQLGTTPYCRALAAPALGGVHFIATNDGGGTVDVITVNAGPVATVSGIRIGSTRAEVLATYGDQVTVVNERRIVYRARDPGLRGRTLVFVIDNGEVASMYAGNESHILTDELCA